MHFQHKMHFLQVLEKGLGCKPPQEYLSVQRIHSPKVQRMLQARDTKFVFSDVLRRRNASKEEVEKAMRIEEETVATYLRGRRLRNLMFADASPIGRPRPTPPRRGYYKTIP